MKIVNADVFDINHLFFCYDKNVHDQLQSRKIVHINKQVDKEGKDFWIYLRSNELLRTLKELGVD